MSDAPRAPRFEYDVLNDEWVNVDLEEQAAAFGFIAKVCLLIAGALISTLACAVYALHQIRATGNMHIGIGYFVPMSIGVLCAVALVAVVRSSPDAVRHHRAARLNAPRQPERDAQG